MDNKIIYNEASITERKEYYEQLRKQCLELKNKQPSFGQDLIKHLYPIIRNYFIEIQGEENIPKNTNVLFVANHSNSHDIFTAYEFLSLLKRNGSVLVATDCLNPLTTQIFSFSDATLFDRKLKNERRETVLNLSSKIIQGKDGLIFGEGTWNIHPTLLMHNIHNGAAKISLISQVPIVPVIFEYLEVAGIITDERKLYKKCIIRFGKPIYTNYSEDLCIQSDKIKHQMIELRNSIRRDYQITKNTISEIDPNIYVNHTFIKKFQALGFNYNSELEKNYLLFLGNEPHDNEYTINEAGIFVPGVTEKNNGFKKSLKK